MYIRKRGRYTVACTIADTHISVHEAATVSSVESRPVIRMYKDVKAESYRAVFPAAPHFLDARRILFTSVSCSGKYRLSEVGRVSTHPSLKAGVYQRSLQAAAKVPVFSLVFGSRK